MDGIVYTLSSESNTGLTERNVTLTVHLWSNSCSRNLDPSLCMLDLSYNAFEATIKDNSMLPRGLREIHECGADPMEGHQLVVGWTSTRRGESQEPSKLSLCFCFGTDPIWTSTLL
ncbi:hypothetical protein XU18_4929 [Perkinsela sp. CCAP 1560/4]|nr:hypothetical protein XU18_4929 [Perkinsela sp. CCAP 1560/4]|eukprot:KNH03734.1 hypothetical protein XU18_4929 [Perkinsela sp. CCAP 1560/4]